MKNSATPDITVSCTLVETFNKSPNFSNASSILGSSIAEHHKEITTITILKIFYLPRYLYTPGLLVQ